MELLTFVYAFHLVCPYPAQIADDGLNHVDPERYNTMTVRWSVEVELRFYFGSDEKESTRHENVPPASQTGESI